MLVFEEDQRSGGHHRSGDFFKYGDFLLSISSFPHLLSSSLNPRNFSARLQVFGKVAFDRFEPISLEAGKLMLALMCYEMLKDFVDM